MPSTSPYAAAPRLLPPAAFDAIEPHSYPAQTPAAPIDVTTFPLPIGFKRIVLSEPGTWGEMAAAFAAAVKLTSPAQSGREYPAGYFLG